MLKKQNVTECKPLYRTNDDWCTVQPTMILIVTCSRKITFHIIIKYPYFCPRNVYTKNSSRNKEVISYSTFNLPCTYHTHNAFDLLFSFTAEKMTHRHTWLVYNSLQQLTVEAITIFLRACQVAPYIYYIIIFNNTMVIKHPTLTEWPRRIYLTIHNYWWRNCTRYWLHW